MMNVALAAVIGVLVAAGSLVAAPVAKADIDFECKPGCWGALAASPSNGQEEIVTNATTQQKAEDKAVLWCDVLGKTNDCDMLTSGLGCLSLAESSDGKALAGRVAPTPRRGRCGSLGRCGTRVEDRPPRLQQLVIGHQHVKKIPAQTTMLFSGNRRDMRSADDDLAHVDGD